MKPWTSWVPVILKVHSFCGHNQQLHLEARLQSRHVCRSVLEKVSRNLHWLQTSFDLVTVKLQRDVASVSIIYLMPINALS